MRLALIVALLLAETSGASNRGITGVEVLVDGVAIPRHHHAGTNYLEALKGKEYAIRLTNPAGCRIAVALSVDGLNTIDARHTDARSARKWVLEPYESVVISGWQTNARHARRFFFTTEDRSYGAQLGRTENFGIIGAAFFREKVRPLARTIAEAPAVSTQRAGAASDVSAERSQPARDEKSAAPASSEPEYAATGMGGRVRHEVQWVHMELEDRPFQVVSLRYEFRPVLVKLGVLPPKATEDALLRRERAREFRDAPYCPEP